MCVYLNNIAIERNYFVCCLNLNNIGKSSGEQTFPETNIKLTLESRLDMPEGPGPLLNGSMLPSVSFCW